MTASTPAVPNRPAPDASLRSRFGRARSEGTGRDLEGTDGDDRAVRRGRRAESLAASRRGTQRLWLRAVRDGLSVVPLSQVVEVAETRAALRHEVFGGLVEPLLAAAYGVAGDRPQPPAWRPRDA